MRQRFTRWLSLLTVCFMFAAYCTTAQAALQAVGPANPIDLYPTWYQDTSGLAIDQCLDPSAATGGIPFCTLLGAPGYIADTTPVFPSNYPVEVFYWVADAIVNTTGGLNSTIKLRFALEQTWALGVQTPGQQITFMIVNMQKSDNLPPNGTFTVTHPFGSFTFTTDALGTTSKGPSGQAFRVRDDITPIPLVFNTLLPAPTTHIGPFLKASATPGGAPLPFITPVAGKTFLANPLVLTNVTGSPLGALRNNVTITGTGIGGGAVNSVTQNLFQIQGKVAPPPGTAIAVTSSSYSRSATAGQVTVFATSLPTANLSVSGAGFPTTTMTQNPLIPGSFFASIVATTPGLLPGVPPLVSIVNTLDALLVPVPPPTTHVLVDGVSISAANFNPLTGIMTIKAVSTDTVAPLPVLTVPSLAPLAVPPALQTAGPTLDPITGILTTPVAAPPVTITVSSSKGGSATATVTVGVLAAPPVAVADSATTASGTAVTINVLANDTPITSINPASVVIGAAVGGTAVPNLTTGAVTFTPATIPTPFTGTASFTYTVADNLGQVSLPATVTVTVTAATVTVIPVTVPDAATTLVGTAVTIPVLANDTISLPGVINPASVAIVIGSAVGGTPVPNPVTGTVTFTPTPLFTGAASFSYTVSNTLGQVSIPPVAPLKNVTINVTAIAPVAAAVAVPDVANTLVNVSRIINLVANDTGAVPASVVIVTPPALGSLVNNLDGTVTYASATAGTATFTYNVKNAAGVVSNNALVTVSVTSAIADAVTVLKAQCTSANTTKQWLVEGNTTNVAPVSKIVTIHVGGITGPILGTVATTAADGRWKFQLPGNVGNIGPDVTKTISVSLPSGASRLAFPVAVTP
jgi:hypothetical protein